MRMLICGSRTWTDLAPIQMLVAALAQQGGGGPSGRPVLIHGNARGADSIARNAANTKMGRIVIEAYPADWDLHGKAAGAIRNRQMLADGAPDVVWAFVDKPLAESRGTADMVRCARSAGIPTYVVEAPTRPSPHSEETR